MIDVILPLSILNKFVLLIKPFTDPSQADSKNGAPNDDSIALSLMDSDKFENRSLPLIYLEFKGLNLMVPAGYNESRGLQHDLLMVQVTFLHSFFSVL